MTLEDSCAANNCPALYKGYAIEREAIPFKWNMAVPKPHDPQFRGAVVRVMKNLIQRYHGVSPSNFNPHTPNILDGYEALYLDKKTTIWSPVDEPACVYTWLTGPGGDNKVTNDQKGMRDSLQVIIVRHPDNHNAYAFQVTRHYVAGKPVVELFDAGLFCSPKDQLIQSEILPGSKIPIGIPQSTLRKLGR